MFVALVIKHAQRMRRILSSVASLVLQHFSTLPPKRHDFRGKKIVGLKMCIFPPTTSVWIISHFKKNSAMFYYKCTYVFMWSTCKSCQILMKPGLHIQVFEKYPIINFHENTSSGSRDGQRDMTKLIVAFCNSVNATKLETLLVLSCVSFFVLCFVHGCE